MKKVLVWDDEKDAFVLTAPNACLKEADDYSIDYYGKNIYWSSDDFDKLFIPTAKLHGFAAVLDNRISAIREILSKALKTGMRPRRNTISLLIWALKNVNAFSSSMLMMLLEGRFAKSISSNLTNPAWTRKVGFLLKKWLTSWQ